jgi:hypothetical protein
MRLMHAFVRENNGPLKVLLSQSQSAISLEVMLAILSHVVMHCLDFSFFLLCVRYLGKYLYRLLILKFIKGKAANRRERYEKANKFSQLHNKILLIS